MQANSIMWKDVFTLPGSALHTNKKLQLSSSVYSSCLFEFQFFLFCFYYLHFVCWQCWSLSFFNFALNVVFLSIFCNMEGADSSSVVVYSRMFLKCALYYALMYAYLIVVLWSSRSRYRCWLRIIWWYYRNKYCTNFVLKLKNLALQSKKL